jgi:hypothetical protein
MKRTISHLKSVVFISHYRFNAKEINTVIKNNLLSNFNLDLKLMLISLIIPLRHGNLYSVRVCD